MRPRACVVVYPGSNCDRDAYHALEINGFEPKFVGLDDRLDDYELIILPGGFSYGDYLRPGAVAAREKISYEIEKAAEKGKLIMGICNGFQILIEMGLLKGALLQNSSGKFICKWVDLVVEDTENPFTNAFYPGEIIKIPIAHGFGRYVKVENVNVVLRYVEDVNGSDERIAGILNEEKNVFGLMPHPERAIEQLIGGEDGVKVFQSILNYLKR
ncbi:phosphoribosylformylglycinamidine synthase subunit PurQ [Thermotoga sp. KOL6]|uniref:phosphoribosylformylglycinamidine synthase subunit PurQ n=1 Tax=Thermotoga sp. KOL6 TaxID=126741 RepID=UPI000C76F17B|nr:phosphoribosylformylglycinamidine synthase subunit PurQ [Thermotoga sp. KOL6]PLV59961.1 phosphoribosylformylglycinamidine synthase [Thermotoga sp. KOL6]